MFIYKDTDFCCSHLKMFIQHYLKEIYILKNSYILVHKALLEEKIFSQNRAFSIKALFSERSTKIKFFFKEIAFFTYNIFLRTPLS